MMIEYPQLKKTIEALPPIAHHELLDFVRYLEYKHRGDQPDQVVQLGGLWADIHLDVTEEDVRALRRQVTDQLVGRA